MALTLVTAPASEPLSPEEAKLQLNIRMDETDQDALIDGLIGAARQYVENFTHRALITQTWDYAIDAFPCGELWLPIAPVSAVTSISYVDTAGVTQTWSSSEYRTSLPSGPRASRGRIEPAYGVSYPSTRNVSDAVTVRFVAGYGAATAVPYPIKQAMKVLVSHWFEHREPVIVGAIVADVPMSVDAMLWPYKAF